MATTDRRGRSHWCIDDDNDVDDDDDDEDEDDDADVDEKDWGGGCENGDAPGGATGAVDIAGRSQIWNKPRLEADAHCGITVLDLRQFQNGFERRLL